MSEPVILGAMRTVIGRKDGTLSSVRPDELYAHAVNGVLSQTKISPAAVEDLITGCVTEIGEQGANIGRQVAMLSNLPATVSGVTLNRMCGSSQQAIHFAAQAVASGDAKFIIAGGVESMSRVPMFSDIKGGYETLNPKLFEKYPLVHQGESAERIAEKYALDRKTLDQFSVESHQKAAAATKAGFFTQQMIPVMGKNKEGQPSTLELDEGIRFTLDPAKVAQLPPVFRKNGVITAANSSQISDGAGAVLIGDSDAAKAFGLKARAKFRSRVVVGGDPILQLVEVIPATKKALERAKLSIQDIDVIEINEAFASVVLAWMKEIKPDPAKVNPNGGAIAHGHPLGATGAILMTKLLNELERRNAQFGLQVMCIGHGMATATVIERL